MRSMRVGQAVGAAVAGLCGFVALGAARGTSAAHRQEDTMQPRGVYAFTMTTIDGRRQPLAAYRGKALLIVNTASRCGFTPQYRGLQALYERYRARELEILAFPANDFMGQEPGTDAEIQRFCGLAYHVAFPLFSKISVKGEAMHPLYRYLTTTSGFNGPITWNFNKFLVDLHGTVVARYGSTTDPLAPELIQRLEQMLPQR